MAEINYSIGLDFGSLSCRGILVNMKDGSIAAEQEFVYPHAVITGRLPSGETLPAGFVLQHPQDYLDALFSVVRALTGASDGKIAALGIDCTSSTILPVDSSFSPLCFHKELAAHPHAWPKMWKHHASAAAAEALTAEAKRSMPELLDRYGGRVGAECMLPKAMQVLLEDAEVFAETETFMELGEWMTSLLAGTEIRSGPMLACKALWSPESGYPSREFFASIDSRLSALPDKLAFRPGAHAKVFWPGENAGTVCHEMAEKLGLPPDTVLTAPQMDGYAGPPGCGIAGSGEMLMTLGTSSAYMVLSEEYRFVPGVCAAVENSILPSFTNYATGQSSFGDTFRWFIENCVPASYKEQAERGGMSLHEYLTMLASPLRPGETGLIALDWFNGNKSILADPMLSGMILGMTLATRPEHIYRALIEAAAFGARKIIDNFIEHGVAVNRLVACGGISLKNPMLMQIFADVIGKKISVSPCTQAPALGSAVYAAAAASGDTRLTDTIRRMTGKTQLVYTPQAENRERYEKLYREYITLHDYFGRGENKIMERLRGNYS